MPTNLPANLAKRVIGYAHVAMDTQAQDDRPVERQQRAIHAYCEDHDLILVDLYMDVGKDRAGRQKALAMLKSRSARALVLTTLDRLTRSWSEMVVLCAEYFGPGESELISICDAVGTRTGGLGADLARLLARAP
jgi:predicted site-specific integrase-resolvase